MKIFDNRRKALVIGISDYDKLQPLSFCKNDGQAMCEFLISLQYNINDNSKLIGYVKWVQLREAIIDFFTDSTIKSDDTLLFYYSGHGVPDTDGDMYLATSEVDPYFPYRRGFSFNELTKMMQRSISTRIIAILDCCYSGSAKVTKGHEEDAAKLGTAAIDNSSKVLRHGEGICLLASSQAYQEAYMLEEKNHSLFTYYLLEGLRGKDISALDNYGYVTVDSLSKYVYNTIMALPVEKRPKQKPIRKVEASGDIILAHYPQLATTLKTDSPPISFNATAIIEKGNEYIDSKEYLKAVEYYEKVINDPNLSKAWNNKAIALTNLGKYNEAIKCFDIAIEMDSNNVNSWENKGICLYNTKRYDEALECFEKAISLESDRLNSWFGKGISLSEKGRGEEALECFDKAIDINPNAEFALYKKGDLLIEQERYDDAIKCYDKAIETSPHLSVAWHGKGRALASQERYDDAIKSYDKAIECLNETPPGISLEGIEQMWNSKGVSLTNLGKYDEAIKCFWKATDLGPNFKTAWYNIGVALAELGKNSEAIKYLNKATDLDPNYESAWNYKALILDKLGKHNEAIKAYDKAKEVNKDGLSSNRS